MADRGVSLALNHMTVPRLEWQAVLDLAVRLGFAGVEFRNDLPGPLFGGDSPGRVKDALVARSLRLLALAEVKRFNVWKADTRAEAEALMRTAAACGAEAVILIPANDAAPDEGSARETRERAASLAHALAELKPMLEDHGLIGLVEPLGFATSSLRTKAAAVEAIEALGAVGRFKLVHDTFHNFLAGETAFFPEHTGIMHVSGVVDPSLRAADMRDGHRVLLDERDRLGNLAQLAALTGHGYAGPVSFECFAREVHDLADPEAALAASADLISSRLTREAA